MTYSSSIKADPQQRIILESVLIKEQNNKHESKMYEMQDTTDVNGLWEEKKVALF
jgi:hypothetical protein